MHGAHVVIPTINHGAMELIKEVITFLKYLLQKKQKMLQFAGVSKQKTHHIAMVLTLDYKL
jgi:hypothetical protein